MTREMDRYDGERAAQPMRTDIPTAIPGREDEEFGGWDPMVRALTGMSDEVKNGVVNELTGELAKAGDLYRGSKENAEPLSQGLTVSVVGWKLQRTYWPDRRAVIREPLCRSHDNVRGFGKAVDTGKATGDCATCPLSQPNERVNDDGRTQKLPSDCTLELVAVIEFEDYTRGEVVYKKAGEQAFLRLTRAVDNMGGFSARPRFVLTSVKEWSRNRVDSWWVVKLTPERAARLTVDSRVRELPPAPAVNAVSTQRVDVETGEITRAPAPVAEERANDPWDDDDEDDGLPW